jgi:hypothetical protein
MKPGSYFHFFADGYTQGLGFKICPTAVPNPRYSFSALTLANSPVTVTGRPCILENQFCVRHEALWGNGHVNNENCFIRPRIAGYVYMSYLYTHNILYRMIATTSTYVYWYGQNYFPDGGEGTPNPKTRVWIEPGQEFEWHGYMGGSTTYLSNPVGHEGRYGFRICMLPAEGTLQIRANESPGGCELSSAMCATRHG